MTISSTISIARDHLPEKLSVARCREVTGSNPAFGTVFTQNMVVADYNPKDGWHAFRIEPVSSFSLHPASSVLHYGQAIFEGLKAYSQPDGSLAVFRPNVNAKRFAASATRMAMPPLPEGAFEEAINALVDVERNWVPTAFGESLYLRPMMFSRDARLTTRPSSTYTFCLIACPVGPYFPNGIAPVSVWISQEYVRAVRGGVGEAKCAGNYAASFLAQQEASQNNCDQVVWLDAIDQETIEEMGGMNLFFVTGGPGEEKLMTPVPTGSLLKGVTRASLLQVAEDLGYQVEETRITVDDWETGCRTGTISEVFACGTAAAVTPVGSAKSRRGGFTIADGTPGRVTMQLRQYLLDIQHGLAPDDHGWLHPIHSSS